MVLPLGEYSALIKPPGGDGANCPLLASPQLAYCFFKSLFQNLPLETYGQMPIISTSQSSDS